MKLILSHLTGNANVKAAVTGFIEANLMSQFHVSFAAFPNSMLHKLSGMKPFFEIKRRTFDASVKPYVKSWPWLELGRLVAPKMGFKKLIHEGGPFYIDAVCKNLDKRVASQLKYAVKTGVSGVYGYEDVAEFSFKEAKRMGLQCFYDLPIGYWRAARRLLAPERGRWPEWEATLSGFRDSQLKLARKDHELNLADRIFVASTFTANTLKDFPGSLAPVEVIPYGFPPVSDVERTYRKTGPLKLLFVGSLTQRKGIANMFTALHGFGQHVQLTLVGNKPAADCPALDRELAKHTWISSMAHSDILDLMRESDVLIFPSLFEGFGLVITEAMSQGTPVITTERTAGPDLITNNENGWLIQAGSVDAIKNTIDQLLSKPQSIEEAGRQARATAAKRPWDMYGKALAMAVQKHNKTHYNNL